MNSSMSQSMSRPANIFTKITLDVSCYAEKIKPKEYLVGKKVPNFKKEGKLAHFFKKLN
jgi:hypothetical protein